MRVLRQDAREGAIKLLIENNDDLWHLHNLIDEADLVRASTYRREEKKTDKLRPERGEKRRVRLGVKVERVEFQEFTDHLRIGGKIAEGPEEMEGMGGHHTFTLSPGDDVEIVKERWKDHQLRRVAEAVEASRRPLVTFIAMDDEGALLAHMHQYGIREVADIRSGLGGKMFEGRRTKEDYFAEVLAKAKQFPLGEALVLLGPGFEREEFQAYVAARDQALAARLRPYATAHSGLQAIQEAMKSGIAEGVLQQSRVAQETRAVEQLLEAMARDAPSAYGPREVQRALDLGAVATLLITDRTVRSAVGEEMMTKAEGARGKVLIVSTHHEAGQKLQSLGGVGALLRFKPPEA